jgi:hypothetical protein
VSIKLISKIQKKELGLSLSMGSNLWPFGKIEEREATQSLPTVCLTHFVLQNART